VLQKQSFLAQLWQSGEVKRELMITFCIIQRVFFDFVDWFTALRFMAIGVLLATRLTRILPMNQQA
jgi:hypothetical protein